MGLTRLRTSAVTRTGTRSARDLHGHLVSFDTLVSGTKRHGTCRGTRAEDAPVSGWKARVHEYMARPLLAAGGPARRQTGGLTRGAAGSILLVSPSQVVSDSLDSDSSWRHGAVRHQALKCPCAALRRPALASRPARTGPGARARSEKAWPGPRLDGSDSDSEVPADSSHVPVRVRAPLVRHALPALPLCSGERGQVAAPAPSRV